MIRGILFDLNGTLIDIWTDENCSEIYRTMRNFLFYQGIDISENDLRQFYFETNKKQRKDSSEEFPEFDVVTLFKSLLTTFATPEYRKMPLAKRNQLPLILAEMFRAGSLFKLQLYPEVREVLDELRNTYRLGAVSDGQSVWAVPELNKVGLGGYFEHLAVSSDYGFRKPDVRLFEQVLTAMKLSPEEVIFVGNDMYRDVYGAANLGMKTVFFSSNQGEKNYSGADADYIIYNFKELPEAVQFLTRDER